MKIINKLFLVFSVFFLILVLNTSCKDSKRNVIIFDDSEPLALAPDVQWALVIDPYAAFRESMDWESEIKSYCKKGEILQIISRSFDDKKNYWYSKDKVACIDLQDLFSNIPSDIYLSISDII